MFAYLLIQCVIWVATVGPAVATENPYLWFFPIAAGLHVVMAAFLLWRWEDFRHSKTQQLLPRVNLACHLTLFRLSSVPTILFLAMGVANEQASGVVLVVVVAVAFLSDFVDGQVARRLDQTTNTGAYLDSSTDYAVLIILSVSFVIMGITPVWYFAILMGRLIGFALAMGIFARIQGKVSAETTFLGKAAVFSAMAAYAFELAGYAGIPALGHGTVVLVVELVSATILVISVADKYRYLVKRFRTLKE